MKITYDAEADAVYIYLSDNVHLPETREIEENINMDFNEHNQLVGIEILAASERLNLSFLIPFVKRLDAEWEGLQKELEKRKRTGELVETSENESKYLVEEVGFTYVRLKSQNTKTVKTVTAMQLMRSSPDQPLLKVLRKIGSYSENRER